MYDDDLYSSLLNSFGSTTTQTEEDDSSSSYSPSYNPSSYTSPYDEDSSYRDDYSVTPNYQSEQSYESNRRQEESTSVETRVISQMNTPMIQKDEPAVVLTKTKQKIYLQARMKIIIAMFVTIVCSLLFVSIFNFVNVSKINASIAEKQIEINDLQARISALKASYNVVSDGDYIKDKVTSQEFYDENGKIFVESNEKNTAVLEIGEIYTEPVVEKLPSNWFNDVCDFLSNLFAA